MSKRVETPTRVGVRFQPPMLVLETKDASNGKIRIHKFKLGKLFEESDDDGKLALRILKSMKRYIVPGSMQKEQIFRLLIKTRAELSEMVVGVDTTAAETKQVAAAGDARATVRKENLEKNVERESAFFRRLSAEEKDVSSAINALRSAVPVQIAVSAPLPSVALAQENAEVPVASEPNEIPDSPKDLDSSEGKPAVEEEAEPAAVDPSFESGVHDDGIDESEDGKKDDIGMEENGKDTEKDTEDAEENDEDEYGDSSSFEDDEDDEEESVDGAAVITEKNATKPPRNRLLDALDASLDMDEKDDEDVLVRNEIRQIKLMDESSDSNEENGEEEYEEDYENDFDDDDDNAVEADLNLVSPSELEQVKKDMDVQFEANRLQPGDPGYKHDVREEFAQQGNESDNSWDM